MHLGIAECLIPGDPLYWYEVVIGSLGPGDQVAQVQLCWETVDSPETAGATCGGGDSCVLPDHHGTRWRCLKPPSEDSTSRWKVRPSRSADGAQISAQEMKFAPGSERSFHFPVWQATASGGGEWGGRMISARLMATRQRVKVYVDLEDVDRHVSQLTADTIAIRLAEVALPVVESWLGPITDVDGDGGLSLLLTSAVEQLPQGSEPLRAFVRSSDLESGPRSTAGWPDGPRDLIYLNAIRWQDSGLDGILAHEATHLAVFSRRREAGLPLRAEEWIDEGLAHAVEWLGTGDSSNLETRWRAFRTAPHAAALEVTCRAGSAGWRQADSRGATARFFAHLVKQQGEAVLARIAIARRSGRSAVAEGTRAAFDDLFRTWSLVEGITWNERESSPHPRERGQQVWSLSGTAALGFPLGSVPPGRCCRLRLEGPDSAALQWTLVRHQVPTSSESKSSLPTGADASTQIFP